VATAFFNNGIRVQWHGGIALATMGTLKNNGFLFLQWQKLFFQSLFLAQEKKI